MALRAGVGLAITAALAGCAAPPVKDALQPGQTVPSFATQIDADTWLVRGTLAAIDVVDAAGAPLADALKRSVDEGWDVAFNGPFVSMRGENAGRTRGAVWRGAVVLDPADAPSATLWTLEAHLTDRAPRLAIVRGPPTPSPSRALAIGGLELLWQAGQPGDSPTFANQRARFGDDERRLGRTYVGLDHDGDQVLVLVSGLDVAGPTLVDGPRVLVDAGADEVLMLDGGPSSMLAVRTDDGPRFLVAPRSPPDVPLRFGVALRLR